MSAAIPETGSQGCVQAETSPRCQCKSLEELGMTGGEALHTQLNGGPPICTAQHNAYMLQLKQDFASQFYAFPVDVLNSDNITLQKRRG